jgi:HEAT repeats
VRSSAPAENGAAALARIVAGRGDVAVAGGRRAALQALVALGTEAAAVELARALAEGGPLSLEQRAALLSVAYAHPAGVAAPRVVRSLVPLLAHGDRELASRAASLLMLFPSESHGPLARVLRTGSAPEARRLAALALGACRDDGAIRALLQALHDPDAGVRAAARASLRKPS